MTSKGGQFTTLNNELKKQKLLTAARTQQCLLGRVSSIWTFKVILNIGCFHSLSFQPNWRWQITMWWQYKSLWGINLRVQRHDWYCCISFFYFHLVMWTSFFPHKNEKLECKLMLSPAFWAISYAQKHKPIRKIPGDPVVRTPSFHCWGSGFNPWSGN